MRLKNIFFTRNVYW